MKKILVIEDENALRNVILDILEAEDFYSIGAENGRVGVQLAQEHYPDLIICDVMMPELDGYGVLAELRKNAAMATTPFIFLTAKADYSSLREGMELGADDYLAKPFQRFELLRAVSTRLDKQEAVDRKVQEKLTDLRDNIAFALPAELNTPLSAIVNSSRVLVNECNLMESDDILDIAETIHSSSQQLHRLIQNFLLYAQLELASADPERVKALRTGSTQSVKSLVVDLATQAAQYVDRQADLQLELQDATVQVSEIKLKKIIRELIDNAFKFSQPGTPVRIVSLLSRDTVVVYITDKGRGMTAEQVASIGAYTQFERKLQEQEGTGLGLIIAKRMVELHGGELEIESIPRKETTIRIVLPIV
ncbi:response regulator [Leptolyngbya sp. FACHB-541]|uniref:hybrid sensor histidine kinase/response regulator n=1 Tax=Leptolyngbya sp. FACHB-541 TaxID=2692810 RepID=UPI0016833967|nr:response regulator [Leptolyngbya sp. FACHB-541]MBD1997355.1 response regulator [Leptolyngbya sp. FACHB-541]